MTSEVAPSADAQQGKWLSWLGEIPNHWELRRGKWLFTRMQRPVDQGDEIVTCFRDGLVTLRTNRRVRGFTEALQEMGYQGVRRGDLVIHAMDAFAGAVGVSDSDGKCSPVYSVCTPTRDLNVHYYAYLVREMARSGWIFALGKGIRERSTDFRFETFGNEVLPVPPRAEQDAIVRLLRSEDEHVERLVHARKRLLNLLTEYKQAEVGGLLMGGAAGAITRLSDFMSAHMPPGVRLIPLRYLATKFASGVTPRGGADVYQDSGVPFIRSQNVHFDGLRLDGVARIDPELHKALDATHVQRGDVLLNITGASIGRACVVPPDFVEGNVNQHVCIIRPRQDAVLPEYLASYLSLPAVQNEIRTTQNGASREGLTLSDIRALPVTLPDVEEQRRVAKLIGDASKSIQLVRRRTNREIELVREFRSRLTTEALRGSVDAIGITHRLPEISESQTIANDNSSGLLVEEVDV